MEVLRLGNCYSWRELLKVIKKYFEDMYFKIIAYKLINETEQDLLLVKTWNNTGLVEI